MPDIYELEFSEVVHSPQNTFKTNLPTLNNENSIVVNLGKNDVLNIIKDVIAVRITSEQGKTTIQSSNNFSVDYSNEETPLVTFENLK